MTRVLEPLANTELVLSGAEHLGDLCGSRAGTLAGLNFDEPEQCMT